MHPACPDASTQAENLCAAADGRHRHILTSIELAHAAASTGDYGTTVEFVAHALAELYDGLEATRPGPLPGLSVEWSDAVRSLPYHCAAVAMTNAANAAHVGRTAEANMLAVDALRAINTAVRGAA